jgi:hypothetical protein
MVKRCSFLHMKADIYANLLSYFLQCTDMNLYYIMFQIAGYYSLNQKTFFSVCFGVSDQYRNN